MNINHASAEAGRKGNRMKRLPEGRPAGEKRMLSGAGRHPGIWILLLCILLTAGAAPARGAQIQYDISNRSETVNGPVSLRAQDDDEIIGVRVTGNEGLEISTAVNGDIRVEAETDHHDHQGAAGMYVDISGAGSAGRVTVNGSITSVNTWIGADPFNLDTVGLETDVSDGGRIDAEVNGPILARSVMEEGGYTWSAGLHSGNSGGDLALTVNGSVTAEAPSYSVGLNVKIETEEEASSFVKVKGDVTAKSIGIRVENSAPKGRMELLVDGTLSADKCISPEGETFRKSRFTLWKAKPLQGNDIIPPDEEFISEEDARSIEKEIRYIIRTEEQSAQYITVRAEEYHGYQVAREGETVTVQVHAPDGYEAAAVYGKPGNTMQLTRKDGDSYELTVPKGGGIELSVSLNKTIPATGDRASPILWLGLALAGTACIGILRLRTKKTAAR